MAKEKRILQMAEDAKSKDDRYEAMLKRLDAKDEQMNNLILQVAAMNKNNSNEQPDKVEPQRPRNQKRKAEETDATTGTGSGANGEYIKMKTKSANGNKYWADPAKFGWPKTTKDSPFNVLGISWDSSWPADKKAYYNARKKTREKGNA